MNSIRLYRRSGEALRFFQAHTLAQTYNRIIAKISMRRPKTTASHSPTNLSIDVTTHCNFKCIWCSTQTYREDMGCRNLSIEELETILFKFKHAHHVSFSGSGETFLHPDLFNMIGIAKKKHMHVLLTTNGSLLRKRMAEVLDSAVDELEVSLKGASPAEHESTTGRPAKEFPKIIQAVRSLVQKRRSNRPKVVLSYVCTRSKLDNIPNIVKIGQECSVEAISFYNLIPNKILGNEGDCLFNEDESVTDYIERLPKNSSDVRIHLPVLYDTRPPDRLCPVPFVSLSIGQGGGVCGCGRAFLPSQANGNVFSDEDVFNRPHFVQLRYAFLNGSSVLPYECTYCEFKHS